MRTTALTRTCASVGLALLALGAAAAAGRQDARKELQQIEKEQQEEFQHIFRATRSLDDEAASDLWNEFRTAILPEFAARYAAVARANKKSDIAFDAWAGVMELVPHGMESEIVDEALTALTTDHVASERLDGFAGTLRYASAELGEDKVVATLRLLSERSPHRKVQAAALYSLGAVLGEDRAAGDPKIDEAKTVFAKLAAYGDTESPNGKSYAEAAAAFVFALDNLVVGKPCPDFEAVDVEGAKFRLSDYEGKVVLVDFWGFW
jgi:hypothetical protein